MEKVHKDNLGRWASVTLKGDGEHRITIITAYRCNKGAEGENAGSVWQQLHNQHVEEGILKEESIEHIDPRQIMLENLQQYIMKIKKTTTELYSSLTRTKTD